MKSLVLKNVKIGLITKMSRKKLFMYLNIFKVDTISSLHKCSLHYYSNFVKTCLFPSVLCTWFLNNNYAKK